jgi:AraC family L-rhamnose operon regulatory protein RhaS
MSVSRPLAISPTIGGILFAESIHDDDFTMSLRVDPFHKIIYVLRGQIAYHDSGTDETLTVEQGGVLIVPAAVAHRIEDQSPSTLLLLCLDPGFCTKESGLQEVWRSMLAHRPHRLRANRTIRLQVEATWRRALLEHAHQRIGGTLYERTLAAQMLVTLARLPAISDNSDATTRVEAVVREIRETFFDPWDLDRAAGRAALSRRRFSTLFRQSTGKSFTAFVTARRLEHAGKLLQAGDHSIVGVMFACGFNDLSHFYRLFRKNYGYPPGQGSATHPNRKETN